MSPNILDYFIPFFVVIIIIESILSSYSNSGLYSVKDTLINFLLGLLGLLIDLAVKGGFLFLLNFCYENSIFNFSKQGWFYWISLFFLQDLSNYVMHLCEHRSKPLWAVHVTHHSSNKFNLSTGFRSSVFQPVYRYLFFIPLAFSGYKPLDILFFYSIGQIYGFFVHTTHIKKLGFIELIFTTPSHHRVHHGSNDIYIDRNMGQVLIIWDRIFKTFAEERDDVPVKYGITTGFKSNNIFRILFTEFKNLFK